MQLTSRQMSRTSRERQAVSPRRHEVSAAFESSRTRAIKHQFGKLNETNDLAITLMDRAEGRWFSSYAVIRASNRSKIGRRSFDPQVTSAPLPMHHAVSCVAISLCRIPKTDSWKHGTDNLVANSAFRRHGRRVRCDLSSLRALLRSAVAVNKHIKRIARSIMDILAFGPPRVS